LLPKEVSSLDILALAIKSEIEAANFYNRLGRKIKADLLKQKVHFLAYEEKKHRAILTRLCRQRFGQVPSSLPEHGLALNIEIASIKKLTVLELFQAALQAEKMAEAFYQEAGDKVEDKEAKAILNYLRRVERSHAALILSEIGLLRYFPEDYDVASAHFGEELAHIGP